MVAVFSSALGATITNLILPLVVGISRYGQYGPIFTLLLVGLIGHAILRHRLMNVRFVIRRGVVYLTACVASGLVFSGLLLFLAFVFTGERYVSIATIFIALIVAVLFHPLKEKIQVQFERYLYREPYDYQQIVRDTSRLLAGTIELSDLLGHFGSAVHKALKSNGIAVYILAEDEESFVVAWRSRPQHFPSHASLSPHLVATMAKIHSPIFRDDSSNSMLPEQRHELACALDSLGAQVMAPLIEGGEVIGFLALGPKPFDNPYFSDDADLLATLANQSSVAIRNAQTHQRVVQLNEELQTILSTIQSGVVAVGAKARITLFNRTAERLIGMPAISAKGQRLEDLPPALARCLGGTLADGEPRSQVEFSLPDAAGQLVPLVCSTSALVTPSGHLVGAVAAVNDISHLKELEHEKRRAERLASIEAIAAGLVHEIRNPLVAVKTFSQLLPTKYHDPEFRETFSRTAGREIRRIDDLLTRFRTLVSASSQPLASVDVTDPIRHTLDFLRPQFDERQIVVRQVWDGAPRSILGNTAQLEQLFLNLCLNAMEAMGAGGELTLRIADLTEGGGTTLLVEVSDTGTGIPEELLAKIFDPFVSTKARGSGLGLAICRGVADAHRARLRARNNSARSGSTFTIEFPVPVAAPSPTTAT